MASNASSESTATLRFGLLTARVRFACCSPIYKYRSKEPLPRPT
jgi:hypothetical protein